MNKTEMNMAAAKLFGLDAVLRKWPKDGDTPYEERVSYKVAYVNEEGDADYYWRTVDIFTHPADCLAAVKVLGEKCGIYPVPHFGESAEGWVMSDNSTFDFGVCAYEEAVGAACVEVMK